MMVSPNWAAFSAAWKSSAVEILEILKLGVFWWADAGFSKPLKVT